MKHVMPNRLQRSDGLVTVVHTMDNIALVMRANGYGQDEIGVVEPQPRHSLPEAEGLPGYHYWPEAAVTFVDSANDVARWTGTELQYVDDELQSAYVAYTSQDVVR